LDLAALFGRDPFDYFSSCLFSEIIRKKIRTASRSTKFCKAELDAISAESAIQASHEGIVLHGSNGDTRGLAFV